MLSNASMPDLVKVGKTTRRTAERLRELSSATGVPTPFALVYEHAVSDIDAAEQAIHLHLEDLGYRVSANKEFFNAPVAQVIAAVVELAKQFSIYEGDLRSDSGSSSERITPTVDALRSHFEELAYLNLEGTETALPNRELALEQFRRAAELGGINAAEMAGMMLLAGDGCAVPDPKAAAELFAKALKQGHDRFWGFLGMAFSRAKDKKRAENAWTNYFAALDDGRTIGIKDQQGIVFSYFCSLAAREIGPVASPTQLAPFKQFAMDQCELFSRGAEDQAARSYWLDVLKAISSS